MVDISKLRKNDRLGEPPAITEVKNNLQLPENLTLDQRSLRKTGRVHQYPGGAADLETKSENGAVAKSHSNQG